MKPQDIERLSFSIINKEAGEHGFNDYEWAVVQRMIHTSADFEYIKTVQFHPDAISVGIKAIQNGCTIITDTNMARVGIKKDEIAKYGGQVRCLIADEDVAKLAKVQETTRALAAVDKASQLFDNCIYVVGNAPTALLRLIELIKKEIFKPALIIGLPVGFVNAAESKEELIKLNYPHISNRGRKGGSNVAASVVNALSIMAINSQK